MSGREMPAIGEAIRGALARGSHDLADRIEHELARRGYPAPNPSEDGEAQARCGRCGGLRDDDAALSNGARVCRCGGRKERLLSYLDAVDPERLMTLDTLDASEPTLDVALVEAQRIVAGERGRGMFLMGLPGRGKTHLMVGMGRALLERDRDAGYYNVARLVSRVQDTYGEHGETRRGVIESVASHEVVLIDDLGKEHASTDTESIVYELFDALHAARATLVLATNVPVTKGEGHRVPALAERYDEAVRSRLRAMCERFVVKGEDRRREAWDW
ncbi:ATP-binding protein [Rubrobacter marinus]|uniref:ATP-binding protein n=1 Tax=Rubrobacter marinus TaxID=2653852 RepID=UPI00140CF76C|nr:ATP-binding protein [Rubrobacter marinus]